MTQVEHIRLDSFCARRVCQYSKANKVIAALNPQASGNYWAVRLSLVNSNQGFSTQWPHVQRCPAATKLRSECQVSSVYRLWIGQRRMCRVLWSTYKHRQWNATKWFRAAGGTNVCCCFSRFTLTSLCIPGKIHILDTTAVTYPTIVLTATWAWTHTNHTWGFSWKVSTQRN